MCACELAVMRYRMSRPKAGVGDERQRGNSVAFQQLNEQPGALLSYSSVICPPESAQLTLTEL